MRLRWKFMLVLLAFSLVPLLVLTGISNQSLRKLGRTISDNTSRQLTEIVSQELHQTAEKYSQILVRSKNTTELTLLFLAREAEDVWVDASAPPQQVYFTRDFDSAISSPPGMTERPEIPAQGSGGPAQPLKFCFDYPAFHLAPGVSRTEVSDDIARLAGLCPLYKEVIEYLGYFLFRVSITLDNGLSVSFPGHGGYPADFDPRGSPAYLQALQTPNRLQWTPPSVDPATGLVIYSISKPIRRPDGSRAGVVAIDILLGTALRITDSPASRSAERHTFVVSLDRHPETGKPGLRILAHEEYQHQARLKSGTLAYAWLSSPAAGPFGRLIGDIQAGRSGYLEMPYLGQASIWAYSKLEQGMAYVLIAPRSVIQTLPQEAADTVLALTNRYNRLSLIMALAALAVVALVALAGSRTIVQSLMELVTAAERLAGGDFSVRLKHRWHDERDMVFQCFNDTVPKLEDHMRMSQSLGLAQQVQQSLLPGTVPDIPELDLAGTSTYCDETGGDYFDFIRFGPEDPDRLAVVVGDVSGHGVSSALLMATARAFIRMRISMPGDPAEMIRDVNRHLSADTFQSGQFMTLFYLELNVRERRLRWVRAGHDAALVYDPHHDEFRELKGRGPALGLDEHYPYESFQTALSPDQTIVIGTDGIWETRNEAGEIFGKAALRDIIRSHAAAPAVEIQAAVSRALDAFRGRRVSEDDVTMVIIKAAYQEGPDGSDIGEQS